MIKVFLRLILILGTVGLVVGTSWSSWSDVVDSQNNGFVASANYFSYPENYVKINEIYPQPVSGGKEQIELFNPTNFEASLSQCALYDGANHLIDISSFSIPANGFLVLTLNYSVLNNDGDVLTYFCRGQVKDQVSWGDWNDGNLSDNAPNPDVGKSIGRYPDGKDSDVDSADFQMMPPSLGTTNHL